MMHGLSTVAVGSIRALHKRIQSSHVLNDSANGIDLGGRSGYFLQVISKGFMRLVGAAAITHLFACVRSSRPSTKLLQSTGRHTDVTAAWRYLTSPFIPWSAFKC
jgi:hypothetical protein